MAGQNRIDAMMENMRENIIRNDEPRIGRFFFNETGITKVLSIPAYSIMPDEKGVKGYFPHFSDKSQRGSVIEILDSEKSCFVILARKELSGELTTQVKLKFNLVNYDVTFLNEEP
jgi:hypothetical protein